MADLFRFARHWRNAYGRWRYYWDGRVPASLLLVALALGLLLGVWLGRSSDGAGTASPADRARLSEGTAHSSDTHRERADQTGSTSARLGRCQQVYAAQVRPLQEARPAMVQWEVHIGAMNKLAVGAISLAQAQEFWNQTREGAARNLADFEDAWRAVDQSPGRCPMPVETASDKLQRCAALVALRHRTLDRAAVALDTWRTHVRHMEMLRRGVMTAEDATRMWLESWREGSREVEAYRRAARRAQPAAGAHRGDHHGTGDPCA